MAGIRRHDLAQVGGLDGTCLLTAAERALGPAGFSNTPQADRLAQRQPEQSLDRRPRLDHRVGKNRGPAHLARRRRGSPHRGADQDQHGDTVLKRTVVHGPVPGASERVMRLARATRITHWIRHLNPQIMDLVLQRPADVL